MPLPEEIVAAARAETKLGLDAALADVALGPEIQASYAEAERKAKRWGSVGTAAYQAMRNV